MGNKRAIYLNPKLVETIDEFLIFVNTKMKEDEFWKKNEVIEYLGKKQIYITKSTLDYIIKIYRSLQRNSNKKLFELKDVITISE